MKLLCRCPTCSSQDAKAIRVELRDDGSAGATCSDGHRFIVVSPHDKYEILYDSGACAFLDDYPREALATFAAALEQFFGFFVRVVARRDPDEVPEQELKRAWQAIAAQSERQLGAFLYVYFLETGRAYELDPNLATLRNRVVHRGYLPTTEEAMDYGQQVWREIMRLQRFLIDNFDGALREETAIRLLKIKKAHRDELPLLEQEHALMLSDDLSVGFSERLLSMRTQWRRAVYGRGP